nr:unnamed protein product [Callosobruchus chinensis]
MEHARSSSRQFLILGDFNAKSSLWGPQPTDNRGNYLAEWIAELNLVVHNSGDKPTFLRGSCMSFIDVTLSSQSLATKICGWAVSETESMSDHSFIFFEIIDQNPGRRAAIQVDRKVDWDLFRTLLQWNIELQGKSVSEAFGHILKEAYAASCCVVKRQSSKLPHWWNDEIEHKRRDCIRKRRLTTRLSANRQITDVCRDNARESYASAKKELNRLISASKKSCWEKLCENINEDIWGQGYKIALKSLNLLSPYDIDGEKKREIVGELFPTVSDRWDSVPLEKNVVPFTESELVFALHKMKRGKAPGPDGVPIEAVAIAAEVSPACLLRYLNEILADQDLPAEWKLARLVLIPKAANQNGEIKRRPICILNSIAKLFEAIIKHRLEGNIEVNGGLSQRQYGFSKGRSTLQAIENVLDMHKGDRKAKFVVLITLDVRNAFSTARWSIILEKLQVIGVQQYLIKIIESYFRGRRVIIDREEDIEVTMGVPQGSVLGPTLWNVLYEGVLQLELPDGATTVAFADDLALVVAAKDEKELTIRVNDFLFLIDRWMGKPHLELAAEKTEAVLLKGARIVSESVAFTCRRTTIKLQKHVKYLGIVIDSNGTFREHLKRVASKADKTVAAFTRILPNVGGPSSSKRQLLYYVVQSIITYGAPI